MPQITEVDDDNEGEEAERINKFSPGDKWLGIKIEDFYTQINLS